MSDNRVEIEVELPNEVIAALDTEAAARGISRDDLVNEVLREEMKKFEKRIWVENLAAELDAILADVEENKVKYFICDDKELQHPSTVLMSIEEYDLLMDSLK